MNDCNNCKQDCCARLLRRSATIHRWRRAGPIRHRRPIMRTFETAVSTALAIAAQALVVGVVLTTI
jgi:hypothetical protein